MTDLTIRRPGDVAMPLNSALGAARRLTLIAAVVVACVLTEPLSAAPRLVTTVEGISEYRLDNGLTVLLMPDASRPTATINVTYLVGSKHEGVGETGMAHLLEHLLFFGTENHDDIKAEISERGGVANGTTWYDRTNYFQTLPAGDENLAWAIRMEADRMVNAVIAEADLTSEMTVVRNEFEIGENSPFRVLMQRVMATAYLWHGYGRSTIGARSDVENVPIERLQNFYRRFYQPDNAIVILSGGFEVERALALIDEHFGAIERPSRRGADRLWPSYTREPVQDGERRITVRRSGENQLLLQAWHVPSALHPDFAPIAVLSHILGDMPSGRLHERLVDAELATQVGSFSPALGEPSLLMTYSQSPLAVDLDEVERATQAAVDDLFDNPPDDAAVERAVNALINGIERTLNDSNRVGIQLSEWAAAGDWRLMFLHLDRIEAVQAADVLRVAQRYLTRDNRTVGRFIPDEQPRRAEVPPAPSAQTLLADYRGREDRALGEAFNPSPDNIAERLIEFTLANGAEVALLPKQTRGEKISGSIVLRTGSLESLSGKAPIPSVTASMLMRGTDSLDRQAIEDRINELQSSLSISGRNDGLVAASISTQREQLDDLLAVLEDLLKRPRFDQSELDELIRQSLASIDQASDDPGAVAGRTLGQHLQTLPPDHPNFVASFDAARERLQAISRDDLIDHHASHYGLGPQATLSFVGDFDPDALRESLEARFGRWESQVAFDRIDSQSPEADPVLIERQLDDKANAVMLARFPFAMNDDHPDAPALALASHLIGGGFLNSRLSRRIRTEEGLSYSVSGGFSIGPIDTDASFFAFAAFAPENRGRLLDVFAEEVQKLVEVGFSEDEVAAGRTGFLRQLELRRASDPGLVTLLGNGLYLDRNIHYQTEFADAIEALTVDDINAAVRRHLDPDALSIVVAGDFEGASQAALTPAPGADGEGTAE
jgi:zinc protease